jgi:hypothetical protein
LPLASDSDSAINFARSWAGRSAAGTARSSERSEPSPAADAMSATASAHEHRVPGRTALKQSHDHPVWRRGRVVYHCGGGYGPYPPGDPCGPGGPGG